MSNCVLLFLVPAEALKLEACRSRKEKGKCPYGDRCEFSHRIQKRAFEVSKKTYAKIPKNIFYVILIGSPIMDLTFLFV